MSEEEWRAFHANPTIEGLTAKLAKRTNQMIFPCMCIDVFDIMNHHFFGDRVQFVSRMCELGFCRGKALERIEFYVTKPNCIEMLAAFDVVPNIAVLETACYDWRKKEYARPILRHNIIQLIDRGYPRPAKKDLPPVAVDFVISRDSARYGAIAAMGALRRRSGEAAFGAAAGTGDVSRIIGRVIWSTRLFYNQ